VPDLTQTFLSVPIWLWMIGIVAAVLLTIVIAQTHVYEGVQITATPPFVAWRFKPKPAQPAPLQTGASQSDARPSIDISRNKSFGSTRIVVKRDNVRVDDNLLAGMTDIQVEDDKKKPRQ